MKHTVETHLEGLARRARYHWFDTQEAHGAAGHAGEAGCRCAIAGRAV